MKYNKIFLVLFIISCSFINSLAQESITLTPYKDAWLRICEKPGYTYITSTNYGDVKKLHTSEWTWSNNRFADRSVMDFDLSDIPQGAQILDAKLSLYAQDPQPNADYMHMNYSTTQNTGYKQNKSYLERITTSWQENIVTWANKPGTTPTNRIILPESTAYDQDYLNVNVTSLVQDMVDNPDNSYGFMLRLVNEQKYARMAFCSVDHPDPSKYPKLEITYNLPSYSINTNSPEKFSKLEMDIYINSPYYSSTQRTLINSKNGYNKDEIVLVATLKDPKGNTRIINGFLYENFIVTNEPQTRPDLCLYPYINSQSLSVPETGKKVYWKIRFTPDIPGTWSYSIRFKFPTSSESDIIVCNNKTFYCKNSNNKGIVKLENNVFQYSDGTGFIPLGLNIIAWQPWNVKISEGVYYNENSGTNFFDVFFERLSEEGGNFARIFIDHYAALYLVGPLKYKDDPPMLYYDSFRQLSAFQLDKIIEKAESENIKLQLCFTFMRLGGYENPNDASSWWPHNPFNSNNWDDNTNNGDCDTWEDILTKESALDVQKNLVKFIIDRWGYSPSIFSWEIINEADGKVSKYSKLESDVLSAAKRIASNMVSWHEELITTIRNHDIYEHPITTSFGDHHLQPFTGDTPEWISNYNVDNYKNQIYNLVDYCDAHQYYLPDGHGGLPSYLLVDEKDALFNSMKEMREYIPHKQLAAGEHQVNIVENRSDKANDDFHELYDPGALSQHSSLWSSLFSGYMGPQVHWDWQHFIERDDPDNSSSNYMKCFKPVSNFIANIKKIDYSKQEPYHSQGICLSTYYLVDKEANKIFGWVQNNNFSFEKLLGEYTVGTRGNNDGDFHNVSEYLTSGLIDNKPDWPNTIYEGLFAINVPKTGQYEVTWYNTETGLSTGICETFTSCGSKLSINIPLSLRDSKYGDIAFIAVSKGIGEPAKSYKGISKTVKVASKIKTNSSNQVIYQNSTDSKIFASYQQNGTWLSGALKKESYPPSYSYTGFDVDDGWQSPIYYCGYENGVKNFYTIYYNEDWIIKKLTNSNIDIKSMSDIHFFNNNIIYVKGNGSLGVIYDCGKTYWCDGYLKQSAPKVYSNTGFDIISQWGLPTFYAGINPSGGTDIYKIFYNNGWKYDRITNSDLYIDKYSEIHMGYNNKTGYFVRQDGYFSAFYECDGYYLCVDWIHPSGAPKVKSFTGFAVNPVWDGHIFYIGEDDNIYKIYWDGEWTYKKVSVDKCFNGVKNYSNLHYSDNTIFYVDKSDGKIHYLMDNNSAFKSTLHSNNEPNYFIDYKISQNNHHLDEETFLYAFPNPNNGRFTVKSKIIIQSIIIYDYTGKIVLKENNLKHKQKFINIDTYKSGIYVMQCKLMDGTYKVIKINIK